MYWATIGLVALLINFTLNFLQKVPKEYRGSVVRGHGLASAMDWPTANISNDGSFPCGTFDADTQYGRAVLIVFNDTIECHIKGLSRDIYGQDLVITDVKRRVGPRIFYFLTLALNLFTW